MFNTTMKVMTTHEDYKNKTYRVTCEDKYRVIYSFISKEDFPYNVYINVSFREYEETNREYYNNYSNKEYEITAVKIIKLYINDNNILVDKNNKVVKGGYIYDVEKEIGAKEELERLENKYDSKNTFLLNSDSISDSYYKRKKFELDKLEFQIKRLKQYYNI